MTTNIPEIILLCRDKNFITAFEKALQIHWAGITPDKVNIATVHSRLESLPASTTFDLIVSPANPYGRLDGAFDDAISRVFSPPDDYDALTRAAQLVLYKQWRGFAPPGTCTLVEFPKELKHNSRSCDWVAICPTMRKPADVQWDREIVYECVWSLLCQLEGYNRRKPPKRIKKILMTPLAVGIGKVSKERWAAQMVLALKHFVEAVENPEDQSSLQWDQIEKMSYEVAETWGKK